MAIASRSDGGVSGSEAMKHTKFKAMIQNTDRYLASRSGSVFMFGGASSKYKTYSVPQFKRYNSDSFIAVMESVFNPGKSGPLEALDEQGLIQVYRDLKSKPGEKNFNEFYRLVFWLLFSASACDEIYNNELSMMRDWCKVVAFVINGGQLDDKSPLQLETAVANAFFLHK